ncbi:sensor histidine kinase inhibitor, KipI family [Natronincola peptidivorans]|uniref:Sensor histidine kinase inhibitor, KipI family n=1 Tax=Natronincola peptidivorans TaxID=426128 RepID=A0A1H9ZMI7_9FIRM|nr:5-oxoprolinase subunit PxpB [Natronincola peptidivorans]SES82767.1 sensor histidine kinase inhibitor, KipI family [Natronincola peptidivorans]
MYDKTKYLAAGDQALVMEFGNSISEEINSKIRSMTAAIEGQNIKGIVELVPTYRSLMIHYDALQVNYSELLESLKALEEQLGSIELPAPQVVEIPTLYGGDYGPDIENVAKHNQMTEGEVIRVHTSKEYLIYMLGFTPGFPYLGGMDESIATPRLETPRTKITAGSVGIAGGQTGIYPIDSPGGWQLIGRTPIRLYDPEREPAILLKAGNYIVFKSIGEKEYQEIEKAVKKGTYQYKSYPKKEEGGQHGTN